MSNHPDQRSIVLAVCGSRHWADEQLLRATLDTMLRHGRIRKVIHGGARGADLMAELWALDRDIDTDAYLPDYAAHGKGAPLLRNTTIVEQADAVIAFRAAGNSAGTDDTVTKAINADKLWLLISDRRGR